MFKAKISRITSHGRQRMIDIVKLVVAEYPRLLADTSSKDSNKKQQSKLEIASITDLINTEMQTLNLEERKEIFLPQHFTSEEWTIIQKIFKGGPQQSLVKTSKPRKRVRRDSHLKA